MKESISVETEPQLVERYVDPKTGFVYELSMTKTKARELAAELGLVPEGLDE